MQLTTLLSGLDIKNEGKTKEDGSLAIMVTSRFYFKNKFFTYSVLSTLYFTGSDQLFRASYARSIGNVELSRRGAIAGSH